PIPPCRPKHLIGKRPITVNPVRRKIFSLSLSITGGIKPPSLSAAISAVPKASFWEDAISVPGQEKHSSASRCVLHRSVTVPSGRTEDSSPSGLTRLEPTGGPWLYWQKSCFRLPECPPRGACLEGFRPHAIIIFPLPAI